MMYGKHFRSTYDGSMYGSGIAVFAVWGYIIAWAAESRVELNPRKLADTLGGDVKEVEKAIEFLLAPDPKSRHKEHEGRRLIKEGEFQYFLPSWEEYHKMMNERERRDYNKRKQAEYRANVSKRKIRRDRPLVGEPAYDAASRAGDVEGMNRLEDVDGARVEMVVADAALRTLQKEGDGNGPPSIGA
jgi:cell wall assembly regulator SMI1